MNLIDSKQIQKVFKKHKVIFAYLFGSQAKNTAGPLSDIDIAVYLNEKIDRARWFDVRMKLLGEISDILKIDDIDVVILNDAPPLISHRILSEGRLIFCQDKKIQLSYEVKAVLKYLDWKPFLEKYTKEVFAST